jgi:hypothetical protein
VWSVPIETEPSKYDLVVLTGRLLLALNPISLRVYESIILSGRLRHCGDRIILRIWSLALACPLCLGRPHVRLSRTQPEPRRVAIRLRTELIMSDSGLQTFMGDDILQMIVCLPGRDGKEAVEQLKAIY